MFKMGLSFIKFNSGIFPQFASNLAPDKKGQKQKKEKKKDWN